MYLDIHMISHDFPTISPQMTEFWPPRQGGLAFPWSRISMCRETWAGSTDSDTWGPTCFAVERFIMKSHEIYLVS